MQKQKIFISHHHSDAAKLTEIKEKLRFWGFECFLAHEDIAPNSQWLHIIEKELMQCDFFLYIGSQQAHESLFCQQEIGMAKGLNKPIITTMQNGTPPPMGFVEPLQAIKFFGIDDGFFEKILQSLQDNKPIISIDSTTYYGFSTNQQANYIYLSGDEWNDDAYQTSFAIFVGNRRRIGTVKIGYKGQERWNHTFDNLPSKFLCLSLPFFSHVVLDSKYIDFDEIEETEKHHIRVLLNDVSIMNKADTESIEQEEVLTFSLYRYYLDTLEKIIAENKNRG